jgi:hypothetical protein
VRFASQRIIPSGDAATVRPGATGPISAGSGEEGGRVEAECHGGQGGRLRPFDRRLVGRVAVARWTLATCVAAGLAAALLLLAQMTLLGA